MKNKMAADKIINGSTHRLRTFAISYFICNDHREFGFLKGLRPKVRFYPALRATTFVSPKLFGLTLPAAIASWLPAKPWNPLEFPYSDTINSSSRPFSPMPQLCSSQDCDPAECVELTNRESFVCQIICMASKPVTFSELKEVSNLHQEVVSRILRRLVVHGLVTKTERTYKGNCK
jgi:hypothetical protein